jgi:cytochrome P450
VLADVLPFVKLRGVPLLGVPLVLTAGATFQRELLSDPATWRGVSLLPGGPRNSAARRISAGLNRLTGERHAHYRKLIGPPLRKASVDSMIAEMARLADAEVASWPVGGTIDLWDHPRRLMRRMAIELLFGGNDEQAYRIGNLVSRLMQGKWGRGAFVPINLPMTPYGQVVRDAEALERELLPWAERKRGLVDGRDLASIIANSRDIDGRPADETLISALLPSLIAASSEAGHTALTWTLFLLAQHPAIASKLLDELRASLGGASPSLDAVGELPYLDAVVKESMRVLPPVPIQMRVAQRDATIGGQPVPNRTRVLLNTFITNRMPELYPEGSVFKPERWFAIAPSAFEFPVFSAGPHGCPGYWFGLIGLKVAVAAILTRYRLDLPTGVRIDYRVQPTMRPLQRVPVSLHAQDGAFSATPVGGKIRSLLTLPQ